MLVLPLLRSVRCWSSRPARQKRHLPSGGAPRRVEALAAELAQQVIILELPVVRCMPGCREALFGPDMCLGTLAQPTANRRRSRRDAGVKGMPLSRRRERAGKSAGAPKPLLMMHSIVSEP
jgi:hypothetical protein